MAQGLEQHLRQTQQLAPQMCESLKVLAMSLPELRQALVREMSTNPVIEDFDRPMETSLASAESRAEERDRAAEERQPEDEAAPSVNRNEDAAERRQRFFDNQVEEETLQAHLLAQLPLSGIAPEDRALAETLVGELDDSGFFKGSIPDVVMVSGASEEHVRDVLAKIRALDPPGCGATTIQECLLAQMDKLEDSPYEDVVREMILHHLDAVGQHRAAEVERALGLTREQYAVALKALRSLEPRPARAFAAASDANRIVRPEVRAVFADGRWTARVDARSTPEITVSPYYLALLENPSTPAETRAFIRAKIARVEEIREAIARRETTVKSIAEAIFAAQPGFFEQGLKGLRPLTMTAIAEQVGLDVSTVSRTVNNKYAATPRGVVELRRFFTGGLETAGGEVVARDAVLKALEELVAREDAAKPLSDEALSQRLKAKGYPVARRTVAKYRGILGIAGQSERRRK